MKQLFLSLFLLVFISCNNQSGKSTDIVQLPSPSQKVITATETNSFSSLRFFDHLKGRVKSLTSSTFLARKKGSELVKVTLGNSYVTSYDAKGNVIKPGTGISNAKGVSKIDIDSIEQLFYN